MRYPWSFVARLTCVVEHVRGRRRFCLSGTGKYLHLSLERAVAPRTRQVLPDTVYSIGDKCDALFTVANQHSPVGGNMQPTQFITKTPLPTLPSANKPFEVPPGDLHSIQRTQVVYSIHMFIPNLEQRSQYALHQP